MGLEWASELEGRYNNNMRPKEMATVVRRVEEEGWKGRGPSAPMLNTEELAALLEKSGKGRDTENFFFLPGPNSSCISA